jgi:hypothetical protein
MNAKIARFSPNQIATMAIKICIGFVPPTSDKNPPTHVTTEFEAYIVHEVWFARARHGSNGLVPADSQ